MALFMSCKEAARLHSESLDRDLPFLERLSLCFHLFYCRACARYTRQIGFVREAVRRLFHRAEHHGLDEAHQSVALPDSARKRMKDVLRKSVDS